MVGDVNPLLIDTYDAVANSVDDVIRLLAEHRDAYRAVDNYYYTVRDQLNDSKLRSYEKRAAAFLFLNKTCFNGLMRVNREGKFNVPEGSYKNPTILDEGLLRCASARLAAADIRFASYDQTTNDVSRRDLVYLDPPYDPASTTSNFTAYAAGGFSTADQEALAAHARSLADRGAYVVLSNNDTPRVRGLYAGWRIETVKCARSINSRADRRGAVDEVLIMSNNFSSRGEPS